MTRSEPIHDVVIAGGGPAGLAAGLFTARYGLSTLILDRGQSSLRQCAYLDNYLGFPGGISVPAFLDLAQTHAVDAGCEIVRERVTALEKSDGKACPFEACTNKERSFLAERFIAATTCDAEYLRALDEAELFDEAGAFRREPVDAYGRTSVEGLYLAGPLAGVDSQALIAAGQAAQVALGLIADIRRADGLWDAVAHHLDWRVWQGHYETERWAELVHQHFREAMPERAEREPARFRHQVERWIRMKRAQQMDRAEVERRSERGRRMLAEHLDRFDPSASDTQ